MERRKYFYHITQKKWGKEKILYPRFNGENRGDSEPEVSRICVAPTIAGCLTSLGGCLYQTKPIYVYRTSYKVTAVKTSGVVDACITGERWRYRPTKFVKVGKINKECLPKYFFCLLCGHSKWHGHQSQAMKKLLTEKNLLTPV